MGVVDTFKLMVAVECERLCNREKQNVPDLKLDSAWPSWHFCTEVRLQWTMKSLTPLLRRKFQQIIITATLWSHVSLSNNLQLILWPLNFTNFLTQPKSKRSQLLCFATLKKNNLKLVGKHNLLSSLSNNLQLCQATLKKSCFLSFFYLTN